MLYTVDEVASNTSILLFAITSRIALDGRWLIPTRHALGALMMEQGGHERLLEVEVWESCRLVFVRLLILTTTLCDTYRKYTGKI